VVVSPVGGIPEQLGHGACGALVLTGDPAALATPISTLLADAAPQRRFPDVGRSRMQR
jgi:glycosyltransferase involved in cell wall biosynthesis